MKFRTGGQTGVDRALLDFCLENQLEAGGWCPEGRKAEDGKIPDHYPLVELQDAGYDERTEANVLESDATLILHLGEITGGTKLTVSCCAKFCKPSLLLDLRDENLWVQLELFFPSLPRSREAWRSPAPSQLFFFSSQGAPCSDPEMIAQ